MATPNVVQTDNGNQGVTLTSAVLGANDTTLGFTVPPCQQAYFEVQGTLSAGSVTLQASFDGGTTWLPLQASSAGTTSNTTAVTPNPVSLTLPGGALLRVVSTGVTGSPQWFIGYSRAFI